MGERTIVASLTSQQLVALYDLALSLGGALEPDEVARAALAGCVALSGADRGVLVGADLAPAWHGQPLADEAIQAFLPGAAPLGSRGLALIDPARSPLGGAAAALALLSSDDSGPADMLLLGHARPGALGPEALAALGAALPLVINALAQARRHARLRADERSREQMVNLLVHDIRSPLVATHASIEVTQRLLAGQSVSPTVAEALQTGLRSVRSAVDLCNDMLEVKRLQSGYTIDRRPVAVGELLQEAAMLLHGLALQRNATLVTRVAPEDLAAQGDARLLRRVLVNLVSNALRFTPSHGVVELAGVADDAGGALISVSDSGPGVAPEDRERIFQPFVQGGGEVGRGTGLGLHFCRQAIISHGGRIWVEDRPGGGCRFVFSLPAHREPS